MNKVTLTISPIEILKIRFQKHKINHTPPPTNKKEINPKISRWVLELQSYDYTTEHRAGTRITHVDSLSRSRLIAVIQDCYELIK